MSNRNEELQGIAIVGMAGRFPGAKNIEEFWTNLKNGVESITDLTEEDLAKIDEDVKNDPNFIPRGAFLDQPDAFDAPFFDFIPREAEITDPQQRLFLEVAWEALENSGYDSKQYDGRIGVFGGVGHNHYLNNVLSNPDVVETLGTYQTLIGNSNDFLATRVAYKFDLKGTAVTVQTACSTSLVAVHMACQSLLTYESDMALAGGVSVKTPQKSGYVYQEGSIFSPDGHCRAFDASAHGTVVGNGVGLVVLKRLEDAVEDGDTIYAVIRGSATNNDGSQKVGFTAPSVLRQSSVISEALAIADVDPDTIGYVETHGTGTPLGDPIEMTALTQAYRKGTDETNYCAIGSVKTNIGHLDAAAGVTGLIKATLALKNKQIPPSLHFTEPNPKIDFANSPFYVNTELAEWESAEGAPRRAGVSSFGIGGTNAHVVLEEAPEWEAASDSADTHVLAISAKTPTALDVATENLATYLEQHADVSLADVAYTLQVGRRAMNNRRIVTVKSREEAIEALRANDPKKVFAKTVELEDRPVAFLFSGQGSQYPNMGLDLYRAEPVFQESVDQCARLLQTHLGLDIRSLIYPTADQVEQAREQLSQTQYTQPSLFVIEYSLAKLWLSLGVEPQAMIGHSIGEYVAATLSGVIELSDALALVAARGRLMQEMPRGSMLAAQLPEADVLPYLNEQIQLAGINGANSSVVAGPTEAVQALEKQLSEKGIAVRMLETSHAFHSAMMDPILETFTNLVRNVKLSAPQIPYLSNVSGTWITEGQATDPNYYAQHLRQAVRFGEGVQELLQDPSRILLEVGPGRSLSTVVRQNIAGHENAVVLSSIRHKDEPQADDAFLLNTFGLLWMNGAAVNLAKRYANETRRRLALPTYPFERQRYFIELNKDAVNKPKRKQGKQANIADWFRIPVWNRSVPAELLEKTAGATTTVDAEAETAPAEQLVLFHRDGCTFASKFIQQLEQHGHAPITVVEGDTFAKTGDRSYVINLQERADYTALLKALTEAEQAPTKIVHLLSLIGDTETPSYEHTQEHGFQSLLFLAQAFGEQVLTKKLPILIVTNDLQDVAGDTVRVPERATIFGTNLVIPQEFINLSTRAIDLQIPAAGTRQETKLADQLVAEIALETEDKYVAYRGQHRFVQAFEAAKLAPSAETRGLRVGGTYLITGATEAVGLEVATHFARIAQAKLVLVGRADFPAKGEWEAYAANSEADAGVKATIEKLRAIEATTPVLYISADVADEAQMQAVFAQAEERFGDLHGVVHTAENMGNGLIQLKTTEMVDAVFAPKVRGTLVLASLLQTREPDFFVLFSRMLSITGGFGQVDSAAANAFLDAFAHANSNSGTLTAAIDFGLWKFDDYEQAQNVSAEMQAQFKHHQDQYGINGDELLDVFGRVVSGDLPQLIVSSQQFETVVDDLKALSSNSFKPAGQKREFDANRPYVAPRNDTEQKVVEIWQELFGVDQVSIHDNFFDLGGNSLLGVQLVSRIRSAFDIELPMSALFESASVEELAKVISDNQLGEEELDELERLLAEIEDLSDDEIEASMLQSEE